MYTNNISSYNVVKPHLHQATCCLQHVACISATYIPLYKATDGQQTGKQHVAGNKRHVEGNMLPGVNAALGTNPILWEKNNFFHSGFLKIKYAQIHGQSLRH